MIRRRAEQVAYGVGLYDFTEDKSRFGVPTINGTWTYESFLPRALDSLVDSGGLLRATVWAHTLVPFIVGMFVRGPGFEEHYPSRVHESIRQFSRGVVMRDQATLGRLVDFQLLLAPVMASQWRVVHFPATQSLVTSDVGFARTQTLNRPGKVAGSSL